MPLTTDYWSIVSRDGGATWDESHIDGPFDHRTAAVANGFFLGDYAGLDVGANSAVFRAESRVGETSRTSDIEEQEAEGEERP